jgi:hypothetical protein
MRYPLPIIGTAFISEVKTLSVHDGIELVWEPYLLAVYRSQKKKKSS